MQTTLLVIGGIGIALLVISLLVGDVVDGVLEGVGPDYLSGMAVAGFLSAFGFVGALVAAGGASTAVTILSGLVAGAAVGAGAGYASTRLMKGGDEANVRSTDLVGLHGTVIEPVPEDGFGMVSVVAHGHITRLNARADSPLPSGTAVVVTAVLSPTSVKVSRQAD